MSKHIKIGTRASKLALWQAYHIQSLLEGKGLTTEIVKIETKGDKILDRALSKIGSKGVFTEELEEALYNGLIDIAVHSAKDLPSTMDARLSIVAFTEREKANDVLVSDKEINLEEKLVIGTSSTRRVALLRHYYPQHEIVDMRGNLQTRFGKMRDGACDAMLLAFAGVHRMEMDESIKHLFDLDEFTPPVGQGTVAIQIAHNTLSAEKIAIIRSACNDDDTEKAVLAERSFLRKLEGGCSIPVFGHATHCKGTVSMQAGIISLDGEALIEVDGVCEAQDAEKLGVALAEELFEKGGDKILKEIKANL
jgi:hydroxymethylbilane synthase